MPCAMEDAQDESAIRERLEHDEVIPMHADADGVTEVWARQLAHLQNFLIEDRPISSEEDHRISPV